MKTRRINKMLKIGDLITLIAILFFNDSVITSLGLILLSYFNINFRGEKTY